VRKHRTFKRMWEFSKESSEEVKKREKGGKWIARRLRDRDTFS